MDSNTKQEILLFYQENTEGNCQIAIKNKKLLVERFVLHCAKGYQEVTVTDIENYLIHLHEQGRRKEYIRRVKYALKSFYSYLADKGLETKQPTKNIRTPWEINPPDPRKPWELEDKRITSGNLTVTNEYLLTIKADNYSLETIDIYRQTLRRFFLAVQKPLEQLTKEDVYEWFMEYYGDKKETTQHNVLSTMSSFFNYCLRAGHIKAPLIKKIWWPKIPQATPKFLEKNEMERVKITSENFTSLRDRVIVEFLYSTGCRRGELVKLNVEDLNMEKKSAVVLGKGQRERTVFFSEECALLLERYLKQHHTKTGALFLNKYNKRLGGSWVGKIISALGKEAMLNKNLHPHRFRHTYATRLLNKGAQLELIGDLLGHRDRNSTLTYARVPLQELKEAYRRCMG